MNILTKSSNYFFFHSSHTFAMFIWKSPVQLSRTLHKTCHQLKYPNIFISFTYSFAACYPQHKPTTSIRRLLSALPSETKTLQ